MAMMYSCRPEPGSAWISWIYAEGRKTTIDGEEGEEGKITSGNEGLAASAYIRTYVRTYTWRAQMAEG